MDVKQFKEFLKKYDVSSDLVFEEKKDGIHAFSKRLMSVHIKGSRGVVVFNKYGITKGFVSLFPMFKNRLELNNSDFNLILNNQCIYTNKLDDYYIGWYKEKPIFPLIVKHNCAFNLWKIR